MNNQIRVALRVMGDDLNPDDVTRIVGLAPGRSWIKGDRITPATILKHKESGWEYSSGASQESEFGDHMRALREKLEPVVDQFKLVPNVQWIELSCMVVMVDARSKGVSLPWIHFDRDDVRLLDSLNAEVDFDLYVENDDE